MESEGMIVEKQQNNVLFEPAIYQYDENEKMEDGKTEGSLNQSNLGMNTGVDPSLFAIHKM